MICDEVRKWTVGCLPGGRRMHRRLLAFVAVWRFKWVRWEWGRDGSGKVKKRRNGKVVFFRCLQITGKRGIYITKVERRVGGEAAVGTCNSR